MTEFLLKTDIDEIITRLRPHATDLEGRTVLITGGRGFLGRYFTEVFAALNATVLEKPARIILLDNMITSGDAWLTEVAHPGVEFFKHNVIEPFDWKTKLDHVIHAAGIASPYYYRAYPLETLEVAIAGTRNMLDLAEQHNSRFTFFSSSEIYGDPDSKHIPIQESYRGNVSCQGPRACYDESKRVGETLCYIFHTNNGIHTNVIRPFNIYGPGMQETDYRVLPNFASCIKARKPLKVYGTGSQTRTFCYITDAMVGFMKVVLGGVAGEEYNIGNPKPEISMLDLVKTIETVLDGGLAYDVVEYPDSYPADEPMRRAPDIQKAQLQLQYNPEVALEDGLKRFLHWSENTYIGRQ